MITAVLILQKHYRFEPEKNPNTPPPPPPQGARGNPSATSPNPPLPRRRDPVRTPRKAAVRLFLPWRLAALARVVRAVGSYGYGCGCGNPGHGGGGGAADSAAGASTVSSATPAVAPARSVPRRHPWRRLWLGPPDSAPSRPDLEVARRGRAPVGGGGGDRRSTGAAVVADAGPRGSGGRRV
jgi:hypothetical protein